MISSLQLNLLRLETQTSNNNGIFSNPAAKYITNHLLKKNYHLTAKESIKKQFIVDGSYKALSSFIFCNKISPASLIKSTLLHSLNCSNVFLFISLP